MPVLLSLTGMRSDPLVIENTKRSFVDVREVPFNPSDLSQGFAPGLVDMGFR